jgi:hypothetical protein
MTLRGLNGAIMNIKSKSKQRIPNKAFRDGYDRVFKKGQKKNSASVERVKKILERND